MPAQSRFVGLLEQTLGYVGLADICLGLAFLAIAAECATNFLASPRMS